MPKLRTYVLFKHEYKTEEYLKMYLPRSHRSLLALEFYHLELNQEDFKILMILTQPKVVN